MNKEKSWKNLVDSNQSTGNAQANIELSISARNLINLDLLSKSDPQCVVYMRTSTKDEYEEIGRTEVINDDLNPNFLEKILLEYTFERNQYLKFELWDIDLNSNDFLGRVETTLAEIITLGKNRQFIRQITGIENKNCGDLIIKVEELSSCKQNLVIKLRTVDLCKTHFFKPSVFFNIWRSNEDNSFTIVHKSSVIISSKKPAWPELNLKIKQLCNNDYDRNIKISFHNYKKYSGNHKPIGCLYTSLNQLLNLEKEGNTYEIISEKKKKCKGTLLVEYSKLTNIYSFFDYIRGNLDIKFSVCIDFTSSNSNGPPNTPSSFHFIDPTGKIAAPERILILHLLPFPVRHRCAGIRLVRVPCAQLPCVAAGNYRYQVAIRSIGNIIQYYNTSHQFAGYGFGALIPPDFKISHCFPLNNNPANPYCDSVDELLDHYKKTIENVKLSGPTCFARIIDNAANMAKNQEKNSYSVLLIITDGVLCDLPQTKRSIIRASNLPISIIIVGVGAAADWSSMIELDSDDGPLEIGNMRAARDIVQFVELSKYINNSELNVVDADAENELAKEVLFEVPDQVVTYFEMQGIKPQL